MLIEITGVFDDLQLYIHKTEEVQTQWLPQHSHTLIGRARVP